MAYPAKKDWRNLPDDSTPVTAEELIRIETGIEEAHIRLDELPAPAPAPTIDTLSGVTATGKAVAKAADAAAARTAIGAGTPVTIPAVLSAAEAEAGTATTQRTISAKVLADEINRRVAAAIAAIPPAGG